MKMSGDPTLIEAARHTWQSPCCDPKDAMRRNNALYKLAVIATMLLLLPTTASAVRRTALVIGNAAYEVGPLRNPVHDASDIATTLRQLGFEVTLLRDADRRTIVEAIDL